MTATHTVSWPVIEGEFNTDWHYEFAVNYGHLDTRMRSLNNLLMFDLDGNEDGFLLAINAVRNAQGRDRVRRERQRRPVERPVRTVCRSTCLDRRAIAGGYRLREHDHVSQ